MDLASKCIPSDQTISDPAVQLLYCPTIPTSKGSESSEASAHQKSISVVRKRLRCKGVWPGDISLLTHRYAACTLIASSACNSWQFLWDQAQSQAFRLWNSIEKQTCWTETISDISVCMAERWKSFHTRLLLEFLGLNLLMPQCQQLRLTRLLPSLANNWKLKLRSWPRVSLGCAQTRWLQQRQMPPIQPPKILQSTNMLL